LIVDDEFAIIGSAGIEQSGLTNDIDMSISISDHDLVKKIRKQLWAEHLNLSSANEMADLDDPLYGMRYLWPKVSREKGRVRAYWPHEIAHRDIYDVIFNIFEPCGYIDKSIGQHTGAE